MNVACLLLGISVLWRIDALSPEVEARMLSEYLQPSNDLEIFDESGNKLNFGRALADNSEAEEKRSTSDSSPAESSTSSEDPESIPVEVKKEEAPDSSSTENKKGRRRKKKKRKLQGRSFGNTGFPVVNVGGSAPLPTHNIIARYRVIIPLRIDPPEPIVRERIVRVNHRVPVPQPYAIPAPYPVPQYIPQPYAIPFKVEKRVPVVVPVRLRPKMKVIYKKQEVLKPYLVPQGFDVKQDEFAASYKAALKSKGLLDDSNMDTSVKSGLFNPTKGGSYSNPTANLASSLGSMSLGNLGLGKPQNLMVSPIFQQMMQPMSYPTMALQQSPFLQTQTQPFLFG